VPVAIACAISPTATDRKRLKRVAWGRKSEYQRVRAQIVLHATRGRSHARIARETGPHLNTVRRWRLRFAEQGDVPGSMTVGDPAAVFVRALAGGRGEGAGLPPQITATEQPQRQQRDLAGSPHDRRRAADQMIGFWNTTHWNTTHWNTTHWNTIEVGLADTEACG
jgi:hypothetical protein